ncbi:MAG: hypothetical protein HC780_28175 [Leptolyngbyaceae cyanobacterium CSU_1_3]|nr:hypothetical protein [Leptolyngbyaceae cyanobacterium CSU_1_3]
MPKFEAVTQTPYDPLAKQRGLSNAEIFVLIPQPCSQAAFFMVVSPFLDFSEHSQKCKKGRSPPVGEAIDLWLEQRIG